MFFRDYGLGNSLVGLFFLGFGSGVYRVGGRVWIVYLKSLGYISIQIYLYVSYYQVGCQLLILSKGVLGCDLRFEKLSCEWFFNCIFFYLG